MLIQLHIVNRETGGDRELRSQTEVEDGDMTQEKFEHIIDWATGVAGRIAPLFPDYRFSVVAQGNPHFFVEGVEEG